ncbi:MAG: cache domain-containing protein, partial [Spirochaetota bacterium]
MVISAFVVVAGLIYGVMTAASIRAYGLEEASQSAETLGVTLADAILLENQGALRARGEAALALVSSIDERVVAGEQTRASAEEQAIGFLSAQQIGDAGYFFVVRSDGSVVYHPSEGVRSETQIDTPIVQRILRQRSGFVRYYWQNPGEPLPKDKFGFIGYYPPWDWYIVATDYAAGFLDHLPTVTLQSLLNGYQQESVLAAVVLGR